MFYGSGWIKKWKAEQRRLGIMMNSAAGRKARGKIDMVLTDDDFEFAGMTGIWDPTLDRMDAVAASQRPVGMSAGICAVTGGGGTGAKAVATVSAAGVVTHITLVERGSGYTTQPALAVTGIGSGTLAAYKCYYYKAATTDLTNGLIGVDADDKRIGQVAYIEVTAGGSGYTAGSVLNFTDMAWLLYEPAIDSLFQDGLDKRMTIPADSPRARSTEVQCDTTKVLGLKAFRPHAVIHAA
jgi:hypothetical protein